MKVDNLIGDLGKSRPNSWNHSSTNLTFPFSVVDLEVDVADGEAAVPLHHGHAVLAGEEAHRLRNRNAMNRMKNLNNRIRVVKRAFLGNLVEMLK